MTDESHTSLTHDAWIPYLICMSTCKIMFQGPHSSHSWGTSLSWSTRVLLVTCMRMEHPRWILLVPSSGWRKSFDSWNSSIPLQLLLVLSTNKSLVKATITSNPRNFGPPMIGPLYPAPLPDPTWEWRHWKCRRIDSIHVLCMCIYIIIYTVYAYVYQHSKDIDR